jgi:hypothetical protein
MLPFFEFLIFKTLANNIRSNETVMLLFLPLLIRNDKHIEKERICISNIEKSIFIFQSSLAEYE